MIFSSKIALYFTLGFLLCFQNYEAQNTILTDYKIYKEQHQTLSCQIMDSVLFEKSLKELLALDPNQFNENLDIYHRDVAQAFSSYFIYSKRQEDLQNAILELQKIKEFVWSDLFNLAFLCVELNDCEQGLNYLNRYLAETPKEYWMPQMDIWLLQNGCMQLASNDYNIFRQTQLEWDSPQQDSLSTINKLGQLQLLDTSYFTQNMDVYYHDLGLAYLQCYPYYKNSILLDKSNDAFLKQKELCNADLWNVIMSFYLLNQCEKASYYLKKYRQMTPWKIEKEQKQKNCANEASVYLNLTH
jgi:hypothetical protein